MRWFERGLPDGAQRVKFADVSPTERRVPSWVPNREVERRVESSLKPPKLPSEFVDAVRHELDHEYAARVSHPPEPRRSERPRASVMPEAAQSPARSVEAAAPVAVVDPALVQGIEQAMLLLAREREQVLSITAGQIAELAVLIARRVIGREISVDPGLVRGLVREGIEALGQHDRVLVRLGAGFEPVRERLEEDLRGNEQRFEVRADAALEPYGCLVETELGQVDESIESRLETLLQALKPSSDAP